MIDISLSLKKEKPETFKEANFLPENFLSYISHILMCCIFILTQFKIHYNFLCASLLTKAQLKGIVEGQRFGITG